MRVEVARIAAGLLRQRRGEFMRDATLPLSVRGMINVHLEKPWIPGFWSVALRAARPGSAKLLDFPIGLAADGTSWFFPSRQWWLWHSAIGHPDEGCDAAAHRKYLSSEDPEHLFDYAAVLTDGTLKILTSSDFEVESSWWKRAFG